MPRRNVKAPPDAGTPGRGVRRRSADRRPATGVGSRAEVRARPTSGRMTTRPPRALPPALLGCTFVACANLTCAPATPSDPRQPKAHPARSQPPHAARASDASAAWGWHHGDAIVDDARICWTVARVEDRADTIIDRDIVVIGYARERRTLGAQLADSRGETRMRVPVFASLAECDGLVKVRGRLVRGNHLDEGPSFVGPDDGVPFLLRGTTSACVDRDDCLGVADQEAGGPAPCALKANRGSLDSVVSIDELVTHPTRYAGRNVTVDGTVWSQRAVAPTLRTVEQRDGAFVVREVLLESVDRELRRRIRACHGVRLRALGRAEVVGSEPAVLLRVDSLSSP